MSAPTTVTIRAVPPSTPRPMPWPGAAPGAASAACSAGPPAQPPLPWFPTADGRPAPLPDTAGHAGNQRHSAVRILRTGDAWSGELPAGVPDPEPWCVRLSVAILEALQGIRPVSQLSRWLEPAALADLTFRTRHRRAGARPLLRAVHLSRTSAEVVEAVAVFGWTDPGRDADRPMITRTAALSFRLQAQADRWLCTALDTRTLRGGPDRPTEGSCYRPTVVRSAADRTAP